MSSALLVSRLGDQTWAGLIRQGRIVELHVASPDRPDPVDRIVKGRVRDVRPRAQSAFVEIGLERPGFLRTTGLPFEPEVGRELIVQVERGPEGEKGARVSARVGLAGALLVCRPFERELKVSRRIDDDERRRLAGLLERCPRRAGWIARTGAAGADPARILDEAARLAERWRGIEQKAESVPAPTVLAPEPELVDRLLGELPDLERVVVDSAEDRERFAGRGFGVELHTGPAPLAAGLVDEAARAIRPEVLLPSGGHLVIEPTHALVAVDVNSGRGQETLETNLEAVTELARQLRLRDLGGTVVIDLIEIAAEEDRRRVQRALADALARDRARTRIVGWSDGRLLHLTRRRTRAGLDALLTRPCLSCDGRGRIKSELLKTAEALVGRS